ncbi:hypothetical protein GCM10025298_00230 [Natronobiforma cellulositropha]
MTGTASAQNITIAPLARDGNKIVDPQGEEVILRGTNTADPAKQSRTWRGQTGLETFELATDESEGWYQRCIRVPVEPTQVATGVDDPEPHQVPHGDDWGPLMPGGFDASDVEWYCQNYMDDIVQSGQDRGAYVMIDYHRHYPIFHQAEHADHGVPSDVWNCDSSTPDYDWRHPEVCGERDTMWHGEDQVDDIHAAAEDQGLVEALAADGNELYTEPAEVSNALDYELHTFWEVMADRYAGEDNVIFDIYNEPTAPYSGDWGSPTRPAGELSLIDDPEGDFDVANPDNKVWYDLFRDRAQPWVDTAEDNGPGHLVTIGNPRWSQYTYWAPFNEFEAENMCYTAHVYTQGDLRPLSEYFGQPSEHVPIFFSEFGWIEGGGLLVDTPWMDCTTEENDDPATADCQPFIDEYTDFLYDYDVHPQTWCFDHTWEPNFFSHGDPGPGGAAGAPGADDWMDHLNDHTPGQWWHDLNQDLAGDRDDPNPGSAPYPDADNSKNSLHIGYDPVPSEYDDAYEMDPNGTPPEPPSGLDVNGNGMDAQDLSGDGLYEDITGDGNVGFNDVVTFFEEHNNDVVQSNASNFDFSGNGSVGFNDVVALFEML